jgi:hypothetical protein
MSLDASFERWLAEENVSRDMSAIDVVRCDGFDSRHPQQQQQKVVAKRDIVRGEKLVQIPFSACFACDERSLLLRGRKNWSEMKRVLEEKTDWLSRLAIALCFERFCISTLSRGKQLQLEEGRSRFEPYLNTLNERERNAICNWEAGEKDLLLRGTDIGLNYVRDEREAAREEYEMFRAALDDEGFAEFFTFERYRASRSVCSSRAFQITPGKIGLMPLADLFNHKSTGNDVSVCEGDAAETVAVSVVKSATQKGEEVFNTYGVLSNTDLLNSYGFCDDKALDLASTAPRITGLSVRQRFLMMARTSGRNSLPDAFREDEDTHTIEEITRLLPPGREDILRSILLHRLKMYPNDKEFECACETYLLSRDIVVGGGDTDTQERELLKKERVELARICRRSEMNCLERAIENLASKSVLAQDQEDDAMFSVFA